MSNMSVTMRLYKIRDDVDYKGHYMDFIRSDDLIENAHGQSRLDRIEIELGRRHDNYEEWSEEQERKAWSDHQKHELFDISHYRVCYKKTNGWKTLADKLNCFTIKNFLGLKRYLCLDQVAYAQGWFFKRRFFKKEITMVICVTKKQMINFFNRYIDYNSHDTRGKESVECFLNAWENGMMFVCAW